MFGNRVETSYIEMGYMDPCLYLTKILPEKKVSLE